MGAAAKAMAASTLARGYRQKKMMMKKKKRVRESNVMLEEDEVENEDEEDYDDQVPPWPDSKRWVSGTMWRPPTWVPLGPKSDFQVFVEVGADSDGAVAAIEAKLCLHRAQGEAKRRRVQPTGSLCVLLSNVYYTYKVSGSQLVGYCHPRGDDAVLIAALRELSARHGGRVRFLIVPLSGSIRTWEYGEFPDKPVMYAVWVPRSYAGKPVPRCTDVVYMHPRSPVLSHERDRTKGGNAGNWATPANVELEYLGLLVWRDDE